MASILCLAHYCDTHGPTPLMVTEGLPVGCTSCFDDDDDDETETRNARRPSTSPRAQKVAESGRLTGSSTKLSSEQGDRAGAGYHPTAMETPPGSPRVVALQTENSQSPTNNNNNTQQTRDSNFRKTYDENDKKRAIPCENCALTLPKKQGVAEGEGAPKMDDSGPILRTRMPYERISSPLPQSTEHSPPKSASSSSDESDAAPRTAALHARPSSSTSSFMTTLSHTHFKDYTSTHEPLAPSSFKLIRASCLRTLSCETLPPSTITPLSTPSSPFSNNPFSSSSTPAGSGGGPIFFGNPLAGYTTAYIFRIPDPSARGRRRVYALMALSTHREWLAMQAFAFLSGAFRELAAWIQTLAELELERAEMEKERRSESLNSPTTTATVAGSAASSNTSSFLRSRGPPGQPGVNLRSKGLAELVGMPDFFLELHTRFVRLIVELGLLVGK